MPIPECTKCNSDIYVVPLFDSDMKEIKGYLCQKCEDRFTLIQAKEPDKDSIIRELQISLYESRDKLRNINDNLQSWCLKHHWNGIFTTAIPYIIKKNEVFREQVLRLLESGHWIYVNQETGAGNCFACSSCVKHDMPQYIAASHHKDDCTLGKLFLEALKP